MTILDFENSQKVPKKVLRRCKGTKKILNGFFHDNSELEQTAFKSF
jgi:hypothetical protein